MVYIVLVYRKYEGVDCVGFKELKDANDYIEIIEKNKSVEYVNGPFAVVIR